MSTMRFTFSTVSSSFLLGMAWKHLSLSLGLVLAIGLSQPAFAEVMVIVDTLVGGDRHDATTEGQFPGAAIVSGSAYIKNNGDGFANVQAGPFPECPLCSFTGVPGGEGFVRAEANGVTGSLRALARASADAGTPTKENSARAILTDNIKFLGKPVVNFDIDLSSLLVGEGFSTLIFSFGSGSSLTVDETRFAPFSGGPGEDRRFHTLIIDNTVVQAGEFFLNNYQFSYEFAMPPPGFPLPDSFDVFFELSVGTYSSGENLDDQPLPFDSFARMAADQSVFIQADNIISANGYNYPGRPGPQQEVPAPASLALLAIGLAGLGVARRRKR